MRLQRFVNGRHNGYVLTHQVLATLWTRSVQCNLPESWRSRTAELARQVFIEIENNPSNLDLLMQQLTVVALAGEMEILGSEWVETVLSSQGEDGCWTDNQKAVTMHYGGATLVSASAGIDPMHTTSMAVCALAYHHRRLLHGSVSDTADE